MYHKLLDSGELQYNSRTRKRRFGTSVQSSHNLFGSLKQAQQRLVLSGRVEYAISDSIYRGTSLIRTTHPPSRALPDVPSEWMERFRGGLVLKAHRLCVSLEQDTARSAERVGGADAREGVGQSREHAGPSRNVKRFRGVLVFKADRLVYHSTLG